MRNNFRHHVTHDCFKIQDNWRHRLFNLSSENLSNLYNEKSRERQWTNTNSADVNKAGGVWIVWIVMNRGLVGWGV